MAINNLSRVLVVVLLTCMAAAQQTLQRVYTCPATYQPVVKTAIFSGLNCKKARDGASDFHQRAMLAKHAMEEDPNNGKHEQRYDDMQLLLSFTLKEYAVCFKRSAAEDPVRCGAEVLLLKAEVNIARKAELAAEGKRLLAEQVVRRRRVPAAIPRDPGTETPSSTVTSPVSEEQHGSTQQVRKLTLCSHCRRNCSWYA
jgi:hypothetical protein